MNFDIVSVGALLVEIIRKELDKDFDIPSDFAGPFPSGDTSVSINAAAKLGRKCGFIGVVGNDNFGKCVVDRLKDNGVDTSCIRSADGVSTAVTFVAYFKDGTRKYLYHLHNAAAGLLSSKDIMKEYFTGAKWVHLTGFTLSGSESSRKAALKILDVIPESTKVSFDPNIRTEALGIDDLRKIAAPVINRACLILPSSNEAKAIMNVGSDEEACEILQKKGKLVVQKLGSAGCKIHLGAEVIHVPSFAVEEVDPTGAGDTFCAAFITGLIEGKSLYEAGLFANAAAALSITKKGPMEGAPTREEVELLIKSR